MYERKPVEEEPEERETTSREIVERRDVMRGVGRLPSTLVGIAILLTEVILGLRIWFQAAAANPSAGFVRFVYDVSGPIAAPFETMFKTRTVGSSGVFEPGIVLGMVVYLVAAIVVIWLVNVLTSRTVAGEHTDTMRRTDVIGRR